MNGSTSQREHTLYQRPTLATSPHRLTTGLAIAYSLPIALRAVKLEIAPTLTDWGSIRLAGLPLRSQRGSVKALGGEGELPITANQS
jgi:hypothetical protein